MLPVDLATLVQANGPLPNDLSVKEVKKETKSKPASKRMKKAKTEPKTEPVEVIEAVSEHAPKIVKKPGKKRRGPTGYALIGEDVVDTLADRRARLKAAKSAGTGFHRDSEGMSFQTMLAIHTSFTHQLMRGAHDAPAKQGL